MNRNDVIDVLTAAAAGDRRTVGEADVTFWCAVISDDTRVTKDEALRAIVEHFRERPGVWLEPGHIVERVKAKRRDRLEREPDHMRESRQAALDARVAEHMAEITAALSADKFDRPSARHGVNPLSVRCPWCRAGVGQHCVIPQTSQRPAGGAHPSRIDAAQAKTVAS